MATGSLTLRPVTAADAGALAALVAELYRAEEPAVLRGSRAGQERLIGHILEHELAGSTRGRFLALDETGRPVGTASVRFAGDAGPPAMPPGLFMAAVRAVGLGDALRFFGYVLRGSLSSETTLRRGECYIYSVVVREGARGRGVGTALIEGVEAHAREAGARVALLRVMRGNAGARRLYLRLGYSPIASTPPILAWLGTPNELLRKELG
jgi:ribosomal protein S18 acetylase RimI-like enzyme